MEPQVEISLITMIGTLLCTVVTGTVAYFVASIKTRLGNVETKVDGQLTETIALKQAVAFSKGEDKQRDKQDMKNAVVAGIKEANGPPQDKA